MPCPGAEQSPAQHRCVWIPANAVGVRPVTGVRDQYRVPQAARPEFVEHVQRELLLRPVMLLIGASAPGPPLGSFGPSQLSGRNSCQDSVHVSVSEAARTPSPDDVMNCRNY